MRNRLIFFAFIMVTAFCLLTLAHIAHTTYVDNWNRKQLSELAERTLTRAEVAVDLSVITMIDMIVTGRTACSAETIAEIRKKAFSVGSLKDIHVISSAQHCSGFPDLGPSSDFYRSSQRRYPARNPDLTFTRISDKGWVGLGIVRSLRGGKELFAVMNTDSLLFDMLPRALREDASMALVIQNGPPVARYVPKGWNSAGPIAPALFAAASSRYPIAARIIVDEAKLATWNRSAPAGIVGFVVVVSILIGILVARSVVRSPGPTEELDAAIESGEIVPYFQPIVSLAEQRIVGCEMLARWIKPDGTHVSPGRFIPIAEMSGRVDRLTEALLRQTGDALGPLLAVRQELKLSFNVTPEQFVSAGFVERILRLADAVGLPKEQLVVELTERQEIASLEAAHDVAKSLAHAGVQVAIDDTGTGHNGLASIRALGAACMKIDKLFVDEVDRDPRTRTLVEMLVTIGREFGMLLVAEGIERPEQVAALLALGVREGQGFLYSEPLPAQRFRELLDTGIGRDRRNKSSAAIEHDRVPSGVTVESAA